MTDQIVESRVVDVIWSKTQYGYVKPKIKMQTVKIGGVNESGGWTDGIVILFLAKFFINAIVVSI